MKKNTYFENLLTAVMAYRKARDLREEEKQALIEKSDWAGVKAWNERERKEFPYPLAAGEALALGEYNHSLKNGSDAFEVTSIPIGSELPGFVKTLEAAGLDRFVITSESSALLGVFYDLDKLGWHYKGLRVVTRANFYDFGSKEPATRQGLEFEHR